MPQKTQEQISYNMSRIRSKDTSIEIILRKALWTRGLRYRKNRKDIFGNPDIVFISAKIAIFCDSVFWHGKNWDERKKRIKKNIDYWTKKIEGNMARDKKVNETLISQGWTVMRFWGDEIKKETAKCVVVIEQALMKE